MMNWNKLQEMQRELDNAILQAKPEMTAEERFNQTLVSLDVEISEIANCSEHFKFWKDNKGKVDEKRFEKTGILIGGKPVYWDSLNKQEVRYNQAHKLTLVEECSDALHFILSLANQIDHKIERIGIHFSVEEDDGSSKEENLLFLKYLISSLGKSEGNLEMLIDVFFIYISQLDITTQELEQAYYEKNEVNYQRLREGY